MWCLDEIVRNVLILFFKPMESFSQTRSCRKTRKVLNPICSAHPNSLLIVTVSKVSASHISSWLMAVLGKKSQPTSQPCCAYHSLAFVAGQIFDWAFTATKKAKNGITVSVFFILSFYIVNRTIKLLEVYSRCDIPQQDICSLLLL